MIRKNLLKTLEISFVCTLLASQADVNAQTIQPVAEISNVMNPRLDHELGRIAKLAKGKVGVSAVHLETGKHISLNLKELFPMASTIKVAIAVQLFTKIEKGELSLMTMVDLQPSDLHPGSGTLDVLFAKPGVQLSVQNLLELMMVISDNSATDILLRLVGGTKAVQERMNALGIKGMSIDRTIIQLIADEEGITLPPEDQWTHGFYDKLWNNTTRESRDAAELRLQKDPRDTSSPEAMVNLLTQIYNGMALKPESRELLLGVMERCRGGVARLKGYLPTGTVIAHKTGSLNASATDDVGIITLPDGAGHVAIAIFVAESGAELAEREQTIAHISRSIYDYFLFNSSVITTSSR
ncbi:class A beta-lactamase [Dyadobacter frigoris]|uniref:beta-lactamase n=1 Tax=Dyadobacter frigoris TaxID=2576211 RepID=A0A4U6D890_9BACT|nr:class A beta-lactamase [Dyadobacter frigoris]TKT92541.1 class A beta-lactamase [Dyadobacter frigoris]GLU55335.1 beta-lactamase [Dyadobacter frigoris]